VGIKGKASQLTSAFRNYLRKRASYYGNRAWRPLNQERLARGLRGLGLATGNLVCVHSSFSALGYVEGGPTIFIQALEEVVGPSGTIMMPTFPMGGSMLSHLESRQTFNVLTSPSQLGALTEAFRTWPDVKRSLHPTNSVAAKGPLANELLKGHECSPTPYGLDTPYGRLAPQNGKILMVNTHIHSFLHHVQELVNFPNLHLNGTWRALLVNEDGRESTMETKAMRPRIPYYILLPGTEGQERDYVLLQDYALIFPESRKAKVLEAGYRLNNHPQIWNRQENLSERGIFQSCTIGAARVGLLHAAPFLSFLRPEFELLIEKHRASYNLEQLEDITLPCF